MNSTGNSASTSIEEDEDIPSEEELQKELMNVFMIEFEELMENYEKALKELRKINGDRKNAYFEIFRVFHTLKGDSAYFEEFASFAKYASNLCEQFRNLPENMLEDPNLLTTARINYSRLSSAFYALNKGKSLRGFRFKVFLRNF
ncbi:MAG: Hpt domain-containing protein [Candidatus Kariarchaeaceae archaeon]|jgi:chemotaxis protein histidine kinase CheA